MNSLNICVEIKKDSNEVVETLKPEILKIKRGRKPIIRGENYPAEKIEYMRAYYLKNIEKEILHV